TEPRMMLRPGRAHSSTIRPFALCSLRSQWLKFQKQLCALRIGTETVMFNRHGRWNWHQVKENLPRGLRVSDREMGRDSCRNGGLAIAPFCPLLGAGVQDIFPQPLPAPGHGPGL